MNLILLDKLEGCQIRSYILPVCYQEELILDNNIISLIGLAVFIKLKIAAQNTLKISDLSSLVPIWSNYAATWQPWYMRRHSEWCLQQHFQNMLMFLLFEE